MQPEFSVVIPTYQQPALLLKCLDALGRQRLPRDQFEVIVVDEGNSPETKIAVQLFARQIAREGTPLEVRYLGQPERRGLAAARNRGWQTARGQVVAFTNDDCLPDTEWLSSASMSFKRGAQVVIGQQRVLLPNPSLPLNRTAILSKQANSLTINYFCQKSTLEQVGGFDEAVNTVWRSESDLQAKFIQEGISIEKCPEAIVVCPTQRNSLLHNERTDRFDALLHKQYSTLFRKRLPLYRRQFMQYCMAVLSVLVGSPR